MRALVLGLAAAMALPAAAKVESTTSSGFVSVHEGEVALAPADAYAKFLLVGQWWKGEHSYSGDAANMTMTAAPGGCWCEAVPGGFVQHMAVVNAMPGERLVLSGGLGPLQAMGVQGAMTVSFTKTETGTHVSLRYAVGGYDPDGFAQLPDAVDAVMAEGFMRFADFAARP